MYAEEEILRARGQENGRHFCKMYLLNSCSSGALVRQRNIPTERLPLVGEVSANFSG
jgi:hypothetical protein